LDFAPQSRGNCQRSRKAKRAFRSARNAL
jgi:hypothetical protein